MVRRIKSRVYSWIGATVVSCSNHTFCLSFSSMLSVSLKNAFFRAKYLRVVFKLWFIDLHEDTNKGKHVNVRGFVPDPIMSPITTFPPSSVKCISKLSTDMLHLFHKIHLHKMLLVRIEEMPDTPLPFSSLNEFGSNSHRIITDVLYLLQPHLLSLLTPLPCC